MTKIKMIIPFLVAFVFVNSIILLPSCTYISEQYFLMNNSTLLGLTTDGRQQDELNLPKCVEEIGKDAFKGNEKLKSIRFPNCIIKISEYAFEKQLVTKNTITFYVPNEKIKKMLESNGIPPEQIIFSNDCFDAKETSV